MKCFCGTLMEELNINNVSYYNCKNCGYLRKNNNLTKEMEKERYDLHVCDEGYHKYMEDVFNKIRPYVFGRCLDYGCGKIHLLSDILNDNGFNSSYYDLYYYNQKIEGLFDTIILIEVFEHILDVYELMKYLKSLLDKDGKIIIMTKKKQYPLDKFWYLRDITHVSFVDDKTMEMLAKLLEMKLKIEDDFYVFI